MSKDKKLDHLTSIVEKLLTREVSPVAPVAPVAPVLPIAPISQEDHNTLISFRAETISELRNIRSDIQALNDGTTLKINDHETRIKILENTVTKLWSYGVALIFMMGVAQFLIGKFWD